MPKVDPIINSFNAGEVTPKLDARIDLQKYASACRVMENFIPLVEGGAMARPGLYYVDEIKDSSKKARLFSFQYSTEQAYIILAEEGVFRFFRDEGIIVTAPDTPYELVNPYSEEDLFGIKNTQSADIMYLAHRDHNIRKLSRTAHTSWTLTNFIAATDVAMTITGATKANPCVISATLGAGGTNPVKGQIVYITGVVGMTQLNDKFFTVGTVTTGPLTFQLSGINSSAYDAWSSGGTATLTQFGTDDNNPGAVAFFEQRFMAGGTNDDPLDVFGSASGDFENFIQDAEDDSSALQYSLLSDKVDAINWLLGEQYLMVGTSGGVWRLGASSPTDPLTAANVVAKRQLASGVKDMDAEMVQDSIIYVQRGGTTVRKATWKWENDKYVAQDVTRIARHITKGETLALSGIVDMDYQAEPVSILWSVRADGQLLGMVYEPDENIYPWFRITTDGEFESVAVITGEDKEDQVWVIVKREIDGNTVRYVEFFKPHELFGQYEDAFFVDSGLTWEGEDAVEVTAISQAAECTITATNSFADGDFVRFENTGTWLDTHICQVSDRAAGSFKVKTEDGSEYIDSTEFPDYPPTTSTTTYDGDAQSIIAVAQTNPCKIVCSNHGMETGTPVRISGALGMTDINDDWEVSNPTDDTFEIDLDATTLDPYTGSGIMTPGATVEAGNGTVEQVAKTISGYDHLEGESLAILTDRGKHPAREVTSGDIVLSYYAHKVNAGLPYEYLLQPMKIEPGAQTGTSRGRKKRIYSMSVSFYESAGVQWGPDEDNLSEVPFGTGGQPTLFTGDKEMDVEGDFDAAASVYIKGVSPLPCTVISLSPRMEVVGG